MEKAKIKIGYAPTRRNVFSVQDAIKHKNLVLEKIKGLTDAEIIDIEDINEEGLAFNEDDIPAIVAKFRSAGVDGIFAPHCNFGSEAVISKIAQEVGKPLLIWGPRDSAPKEDGLRTRDTQCGLFATGKVLRRFQVPYTYLPNDTMDSQSFTRGFKGFVAVCAVIKGFRNLTILQIAPRPSDFWTMIVNEGELLEKFNVKVFPVTLSGVSKRVRDIVAENGGEYKAEVEALKNNIDCANVDDVSIGKIAALKLAVMELVKAKKCSAVAIQCWDDMQAELEIMPCVTNGIFCDLGIPMTCETDIHGAICSVMIQEAAMRTTPIFFADLTVRHPSNDNAELLWHCGNFPQGIAKNAADRKLARHFIMPSHCAGTGNWELKSGDITICRFDGDNGKYQLFIGEGKSCDGPKTLGTYVWFEVNDWPMWEKKLVEGPYVHHCAGVHAKVAPILYEACKYIPYLEPDCADPDEAAIAQWWLGR